ncbi:hypothetical protein [Yinghuangia seranimata]|uniref:hypothetical protein n=1 Tax=Yinghuangia seranimata TaxID=408067 RepID=UPI00248B9649|nr:hypothetical protein [Yinghuangia seranimata]MDI2129323.1 hypothetical protein [Yinghuangia seranimata]
MDDNSWRAAQAAREPVVDGTTRTGLPMRMPQANLVPGAAVDAVPGAIAAQMLGVSRDPQDVRNRLESFVQGLEQARTGAEPPLPPLPPNPMTAPSPLATAQVSTAMPNKPAAPAETTPRKSAATSIPAARRPSAPRPPKKISPAAGHPPMGTDGGPADDAWGDGWKTFRPGS